MTNLEEYLLVVRLVLKSANESPVFKFFSSSSFIAILVPFLLLPEVFLGSNFSNACPVLETLPFLERTERLVTATYNSFVRWRCSFETAFFIPTIM
jgi:hypothetical protein